MQGQEGKPEEHQTSHREHPVGGHSCGVDDEGDAETIAARTAAHLYMVAVQGVDKSPLVAGRA